MRKIHILVLLMMAGWVTSAQAWVLLDDFDSYDNSSDTHTTVATGGVWTSVFDGTGNSHVIDLAEGGQALQALGGAAWRGAERDISGTDAAVLVDEVQTYYWQVYVYDSTGNYVEPGGNFYDFMMGLAPDVSNIDETNAWADFSVMPFIDNGPADPYIVAAASGTYWAPMAAETWTNVWVVINNDAVDPTFALYYSTGEDAPVLVTGDANWRNHAVNLDLNAIGFMAAGVANSAILIDNIFYTAGEDLTIPANVTPYDPAVLPDNGDGTVGDVDGANALVDFTFKAGPDPNELRNAPFNPDILTHYIYHSKSGADANFIETPISVAQVSLTDPNVIKEDVLLQQGVYYEWYVEEGVKNADTGVACLPGDPNNIVGPVWSFTTVAAKPTLTGPDNAVTDTSGNASFTVGYSATAETFQWFDGATDTALTEGGLFTGTQTPTLTVTGATLADEGEYYCLAYYGLTASDPAVGRLWTPRLIGHWKFDGDMTDSVALEVAGAPTHDGALTVHDTIAGPGDPNYASDIGETGIDGDAMWFYNDGDFVEIPEAAYFDFYHSGLTVSCWYKLDTTAGWTHPIIKLEAVGGVSGLLFGVDPTYRSDCRFIFEGALGWPGLNSDDASDPRNFPAGPVDYIDGEWHMMTATYDAATNTASFYADGALADQATPNFGTLGYPNAPLRIGGSNLSENPAVRGGIDDVRIYSKALSAAEVADLYLEFKPADYICVVSESSDLETFDLTNDCRVNLEDFALVASQWLECQRVPVDSCDWPAD